MTSSIYFDLTILIPILDDSESLCLLLDQIDILPELEPLQVQVLVVNDGGSEVRLEKKYGSINKIQVLTLVRNFGHQKAIAFGLAYLAENLKVTNVVVMDGDGEDKASDIVELIRFQIENPQHIVFASRVARKESLLFRLFYRFYKIVFRGLTGEKISFGNFCIIPGYFIKTIAYMPDIMIHVAAGILKSRLPITTINVSRGTRLKGNSKMMLTSLIIHGFSAFAVYADTILARLFLFLLVVGILTSVTLGFVSFLNYFTDVAIAGWFTSASLGFAIVALLGITLTSIVVLFHLTNRIHLPTPPAFLYRNFILGIESLTIANDDKFVSKVVNFSDV